MTLPYKNHLTLMADYNRVMNGRLITLLTPVPDADLLEARGAFFGSILGTLNHLLVADLMWLNRMRDLSPVLAALDGLPKPTALSEMLYSTFSAYAPAREQIDALYIAFIASLSDEALAAAVSYHNSRGEPQTKTVGLVLSHVFNHQTHHRGQVTTLLSQMGLDIGVTDLIAMVPNL